MTKYEQLERLRKRLARLNQKIRTEKEVVRRGFRLSGYRHGDAAVSSFKTAQKAQRNVDNYKCRARHVHLAMNYISGNPLAAVERTAKTWPNVEWVLKNFKEVGIPVTEELEAGVNNWFAEHIAQSTKQKQFETEELLHTRAQVI